MDKDRQRSRSREKELVLARKLFTYAAIKYCNQTLHNIGGVLNRDHSNIAHYKKSINDFIDIGDKIFIEHLSRLEKQLMAYKVYR